MKKLVVILMFVMFLMFVSCKTVRVYDDEKTQSTGQTNTPATGTMQP